MTVAEAVMRIAVGTVIIGSLALKTEWQALYGGTLFINGSLYNLGEGLEYKLVMFSHGL